MTTRHKTDDVYGISRDLPLNYVSRPSADDRLIENLTRRKHIVIHGSSKQGKTSLRKSCLAETEHIVVQCSNKWDLAGLHEAILKRAGFQITLSTKKTTSGKAKIRATLSASLLGLGGKLRAEKETADADETSQQPLELDPTDVNDIISALLSISFTKYIVLEDFHYLQSDTQKDFAVSLKAFHEASDFCFIIIGVWLEENRLIVYNGDLTGRIVSVNADKWEPDELLEVIEKGAKLLNVEFSTNLKHHLLSEAHSSVYIVQEACRQVCLNSKVFQTELTTRSLGADMEAGALIETIVAEQNARYRSFIVQYSDGFQDSELRMYRWILTAVLLCAPNEIQRGLTYPQIRKTIQALHPAGATLNLGNLTIALQSVAALQVKKNIKPIILDYDETNRRLSVVDLGFIIWLAKQDKRELLETSGHDAAGVQKILQEHRRA